MSEEHDRTASMNNDLKDGCALADRRHTPGNVSYFDILLSA